MIFHVTLKSEQERYAQNDKELLKTFSFNENLHGAMWSVALRF